jgi:uncharacterized protein YjiS (DUF1127 family)
MPTDDRRRGTVGVVACAVALDGDRVRLVFDDVAASSSTWPHEWKTTNLFTWLECDASAFAKTELTERQLADIGLTLVARLAAMSKA